MNRSQATTAAAAAAGDRNDQADGVVICHGVAAAAADEDLSNLFTYAPTDKEILSALGRLPRSLPRSSAVSILSFRRSMPLRAYRS